MAESIDAPFLQTALEVVSRASFFLRSLIAQPYQPCHTSCLEGGDCCLWSLLWWRHWSILNWVSHRGSGHESESERHDRRDVLPSAHRRRRGKVELRPKSCVRVPDICEQLPPGCKDVVQDAQDH